MIFSGKTKTLVTSLILIIFISLFLYSAGPEIGHLLKIDDFINNPVTIVVTLLLTGIAFRLFLTNIEKNEYVFLADAIVVAATIGLLLEVPHIQSIFNEKKQSLDIAGEWMYEISNSGIIKHGGISEIEVKSDEIYINGHRRFTQKLDSNTETQLAHIPNDGNYWETDFVTVYGQEIKKIHFVYTIRLNGDTTDSAPKIVKGYCVLTPRKVKDLQGNIIITELIGTYTHLAPHTLSGDLKFVRMKKEQALNYIKEKVEKSNEIGT